MADLRIDETFDLPAPPERVFELLAAPSRIVGCLPGATLDEQSGDDTYRGSLTVKLGAVTVVYRGEVVFEEVDAQGLTLRMKGEGRERTGSGSARMTMTSSVEALDDGGSRTSVGADVKISGKMVRFGRGMIQRVSHEVFREFTACLAEKIEAEGDGAGDAVREAGSPGEDDAAEEESVEEQEGAGSDGAAEGKGAAAEAGTTAEDTAKRPATPQEETAGAGFAEDERAADAPHDHERQEAESDEAASDSAPSLSLGPLLWRAFVGWLKDLFGRGGGKR